MAAAQYGKDLPSPGPSTTDTLIQRGKYRISQVPMGNPRTPPPPILPPPSDPLPSPPTTPLRTYPSSGIPQDATPSPPTISRLRMAPAPYNTISSSTSEMTIHAEKPPQTISPRSSSLLDSVVSPIAPSVHARNQSASSSIRFPGEPAKSSRIPSRRLLQSALDLAQRAVELDRANDVSGALMMYRDAVARLRSVMERVGMELGPLPPGTGLPEQSEQEKQEIAQARRRRRSNTGRSEEEGKTLKGIHDAYIARIALLAAMTASEDTNNRVQTYGSNTSFDTASHPSNIQSDQFKQTINGVTPKGHPPVVHKRQASLSAGLDDLTVGNKFSPSGGTTIELSPSKRASQSSYSSSRHPTLEEGVRADGGNVEMIGGASSRDSSTQDSFPRSASRGSRLGQTMSSGPKSMDVHHTQENALEPRPPISPRRTSLQSYTGSASTSIGQRGQPQQEIILPLSAPARDTLLPRAIPSPTSPTSFRTDTSLKTAEGLSIADVLSMDPKTLKRQRSVSQPGSRRPSNGQLDEPPLVPPLFLKRSNTDTSEVPTTPYSFSGANRRPLDAQQVVGSLPETVEASMGFSLGRPSVHPSPLPDPPPTAIVRRPFYLLRLIHESIVSPTGGFINERLHLPRPLWTQNSAKLAALDTKVRVLEILAQNVSSVGRTGATLLYAEATNGMTNVAAKDAGKRAGDFARELEELEALLDEIQEKLGKKLGVGTAVINGRKPGTAFSAFGSKLSRSLDRMTNGKTVDSSATYFEALARFSWECQVMDHHLACLVSPISTPTLYDTLSKSTRDTIESRLRRVADFLNTVVLAFVLPDINVLLARYLKLSSRYLED